jgi:hypothetical protein
VATIVGGIATTHVPVIGKAIAEQKQRDPYWQPFFKGFDYVHYWLARTRPDIAVVFYNDHGLNSSSTSCRPSPSVPPMNIAARMKAGAFRCRSRSAATRPCLGTS